MGLKKPYPANANRVIISNMKYYVRILCILLIWGMLVLLCGCSAVPEKNSVVGFHMDTVITLTGYCSEELLSQAMELCAEYEKLLSRTVEDSDVWNINHSNGTPVTVSDSTAELIALSLEICEKSGGALDITIAPAVELWDFTSGDKVLPDAQVLAMAADRVDYTRVSIDGNAVTLPEDMEIDLGAVAKGYIADKVADFLREKGVESAVLNFGGNVIAIGGKPDGSMWNIGIQDPELPTGDSIAVLGVKDSSVVTSGVYQRGFELDGVWYHHILDAATGWPVDNGVASVTIISDRSALGDALSTACFVLGNEGLAFAESLGVEAVLIYSDGTAECTENVKKLLMEQGESLCCS